MLIKMKVVFLLLVFHVSISAAAKVRKPRPFNYTQISQKFINPNFIRDRFKNIIFKPAMPQNFRDRFRKPWTPAWMDYCDPYHCNDYHKVACGMNRKHQQLKWFQSGCHMILSNECADYRGNLKYVSTDPKYCRALIMSVRHGCRACEPGGPLVCAVSSADNRVTLFRDRCAMQQANCAPSMFDEYEEVDIGLCTFYLQEAISGLNQNE